MVGRTRSAALLGLALGCISGGEAWAGPYYRLNPYPAEVQGGLAFETSGEGGLVGGTLTLDYRVAHVNEQFSVYAGARVHGSQGPLATGFGDNHHYAALLILKLQKQVDGAQNVFPYILFGPGFLSYSGHPDQDGLHGSGQGVAAEVSAGTAIQLSDRLGFYGDLGVIVGAPRAAYVRAGAGIQFSFGPHKESWEAR